MQLAGTELDKDDGSFFFQLPPNRLIMTVKIMTIMIRMSDIIPAMMYIKDSLWMKDLRGWVALTSVMLETLIIEGSFVVVTGSST